MGMMYFVFLVYKGKQPTQFVPSQKQVGMKPKVPMKINHNGKLLRSQKPGVRKRSVPAVVFTGEG